MHSSREILLESDFVSRTRRSLKIFSFALFFCLLASILAGGNLFLNYTFAVENGSAEDVFYTPPPKLYDEIYASFSGSADAAVQKMVFDALPETELLPSASARRQAEKKIGVYVHMNNVANKTFLAKEIEKLKQLDHPSILFDVKGSYVYFNSSSAIAKENGLIKPLYDLPKIVEQLNSAGIYTIARVIAVKDPQFAFGNPEVWLTGKYSREPVPEWVDPTDSEVIEYNRQIISEIVAAGVDEINLDFIRYPDKFTSAFLGLTGQQKIQNITNFVAMAREAIDSQKRDAILSVDTFAVIPWEDANQTANALGQDIRKLADLADIISPMLYPSTFSRDNQKYYLKGTSFEYSTVYLTLQKYQRLLGDNAKKLRPWIQGFYTTTKQMRDQIAAVFDAGICGFTVWDIQNDYSETYKILGETGIPASCR
ncbi:MAG: putative glycoside hydrolase [Patescibacteria group bacterium]